MATMQPTTPSRTPAPAVLAAMLLSACASSIPAQLDLAQLRERFRGGDYRHVVDVVSAARSLREADEDALCLGSEAALHLGEVDAARLFAGDVLRRSPKDPRGHLLTGHSLAAMADRMAPDSPMTRLTWIDAGMRYQEARRLGADAFEAGFFAAQAFEWGGDAEASLREIDAALAARPGHEFALHLKARILAALGRHAEARALLRTIMETGSTGVEAALAILDLEMAGGDRPSIQEAMIELAGRFPGAVDLYARFADRYFADAPPLFLKETMEKILARTPATASRLPLWYLAGAAQMSGQAEEALSRYEQYRDLGPGTGDGHLGVGYALAALGRYRQAKESFDRARALGVPDPDRLFAGYEMLVAALEQSKEHSLAAEIQQTVVQDRGLPLDSINLGSLLFHAGRRQEALDVYSRLLAREELDRSSRGKALNYRGLAFAGLDRREDAAEDFRNAVELGGDDALDARENLGVIALLSGRPGEAAAHFARALEEDSARPRARYHLLRATRPEFFEGFGAPR